VTSTNAGAPCPCLWDMGSGGRQSAPGGSVGLQPHEKSNLQKGPFRPGLFDPPQIIAPKQICHPDPEHREGGRICGFFFEGARLQPCHQKSPKMRPGAPHPAFGMWDRRTVVRPALPGGSAGLSATKRGVHGMAFMPGLFRSATIITPNKFVILTLSTAKGKDLRFLL
jgi:hypothetical protein